MFESNPKVTEAVEAVAEALMETSPGNTINYTALSRAAGMKITSQDYIMQRALKKAEERTGAIFENVHGKGYQRLPSHEIPTVGAKANTRIRKHARRARKRLEGVRANDLGPKEFAAVAAYRSHFGMIEGLARPKTVEALEGALISADHVPPKQVAARMAELMKGKR